MEGLTTEEFPYYRDFPVMIEEVWDQLFDKLGDGNYRLIAMTHLPEGWKTAQMDKPIEQDLYRGQFLISQQGMDNLEEWLQEVKND